LFEDFGEELQVLESWHFLICPIGCLNLFRTDVTQIFSQISRRNLCNICAFCLRNICAKHF
jgi:hypothetical protein